MNNSLKGHLLIASPSLVAPVFSRSVILMIEHTEQGAMGVILNRPTEATVTNVAEQVFNEPLEWEKLIHLGGPVPGPLLVVHALPHLADHCVIEGVYSSFDPEKVEALLREQQEPCLIVANYSGWGPGQLEGEIAEDSWLTWPANSELVFEHSPRDLWYAVIQKARGTHVQEMFGIRESPSDPTQN